MVTLTTIRPGSETRGGSRMQLGYRDDDLSDHAHRQLIGYIGLVLPILLIVLVTLRDGVVSWRSLDSISAYYYTGAVAAFVGMLVALALFNICTLEEAKDKTPGRCDTFEALRKGEVTHNVLDPT